MFFLAAELGYTVRDLLERMTAIEYEHWQAFYRVKWRREEKANKEAERQAKSRRSRRR